MGAVNKRSLTLTIDGTERAAELSNARVTSGKSDADFLSFAEAAAGGARAYKFAGTAKQDTTVDSVWDVIWAQAGIEIPIVYRPNGNAVASVSQPHYTMTAVISEPDGDFLGGDADASTTAYQTVDFEWELTGKPVKVIA